MSNDMVNKELVVKAFEKNPQLLIYLIQDYYPLTAELVEKFIIYQIMNCHGKTFLIIRI